MSKEENSQLLVFLQPFEKELVDRVMWLREFVWDLYPQANELIYDNYNAVAFGWSPTTKLSHSFCSIAVGRSSKNVHFGFYWGSKIEDPKKLLLGEGNQYRYFLVNDRTGFPKPYAKTLLKSAWNYSNTLLQPASEISHGQTIVKSVSAKKRPEKKEPPKTKNKK